MSMTKDKIAQVLRTVPALDVGSDLVSGGHLVWSTVCDTYVSIKLALPPSTTPGVRDRIAEDSHRAVKQLAASSGTSLDSFIIEFVNEQGTVVSTARFGGMTKSAAPSKPSSTPPSGGGGGGGGGHTPIAGLKGQSSALPSVRHVIAVGAGKGGVGKSSLALALAIGLARKGHAVGVLDADIYGPSMPTMMGLASMQAVVHEGMLQPFYVHGVKAMTIGKLVDPEKPLIWRGPMAHGAFKQLADQTNWGELDYLIIDLPPGTGDVSLTMAQMLRLSGAVVVCTPQKVAQDDAVRAAKMFQQLKIPVLGVVENMSAFIGDDGKSYEIFGKGGAEMMAQRLNVPFLGAVPITMSLRVNSDSGDPIANFTGTDVPGKKLAAALDEFVRNVEGQVALEGMRSGAVGPTLTIS